jgi:hypothetical protein
MTRITQLPPPPTRDDAANFDARADEFLPALVTFGEEINQVADEVNAAADRADAAATTAINAPATVALTDDSLTLGTGLRSFTTQPDKNFVTNMWVAISRGSAWMKGYVTEYDSVDGDMTVQVVRFAGTGTFTGWTISPSSPEDASGLLDLADGSTIADTAGVKQKVGYRSLPISRTLEAAGTFALADQDKAVLSSAFGVTMPPDAFPLGALVRFMNSSTTTKTITRGTGVTIHKPGTATSANISVPRNTPCDLWQYAPNVWLAQGV